MPSAHRPSGHGLNFQTAHALEFPIIQRGHGAAHRERCGCDQHVVWADQPSLASYTPSPAYSYNATGGTIQINRTASGTYIVLLTSPSGWTGSTIGVAVTAYGSLGAQCSIMYQVVNGMTLEVSVQCFDFVTHLNVAAQFTLLVVGSGSLTPRSAFAFGNQPSAPSYTPNPLASYTSGPGSMVTFC